jgi:hypothetical protein
MTLQATDKRLVPFPGGRRPHCHFTPAEVVLVRFLVANGVPRRALALRFKTTAALIGAIARGDRYADYTPATIPDWLEHTRHHWEPLYDASKR